MRSEKRMRFPGHMEVLSLGQAQRLASGFNELRTALSVRFRGAGNFGNAFSNQRFGNDDVRLAVTSIDGLDVIRLQLGSLNNRWKVI